jgi:hypothetical protein
MASMKQECFCVRSTAEIFQLLGECQKTEFPSMLFLTISKGANITTAGHFPDYALSAGNVPYRRSRPQSSAMSLVQVHHFQSKELEEPSEYPTKLYIYLQTYAIHVIIVPIPRLPLHVALCTTDTN